MKALVCHSLGPVTHLTLETDFPQMSVGDDEVCIDVKAAALNFPDTLIIEGKYQVKPELPFIPGAECAGTISAVGDKVKAFKVGDKVIGISSHGAFCQRRVLPEVAVNRMPVDIGFAEAASISMTYFTSYHALKQRGRLQTGETVLVLGAGGGVGIAAVELAKVMGAKVIAAASSAEKLKLAKQKGADYLINYSTESLKDQVKQITQGQGVDVVYDPVGGEFSEMALRSIAWKGRFLVVGFANGEIPKIPLNLPLLKGCEIVGVFMGAFSMREFDVQHQNMLELWQLFEEKKLQPIVNDVYAIEDYVDAFNCLSQRKAKGKVIMTF